MESLRFVAGSALLVLIPDVPDDLGVESDVPNAALRPDVADPDADACGELGQPCAPGECAGSLFVIPRTCSAAGACVDLESVVDCAAVNDICAAGTYDSDKGCQLVVAESGTACGAPAQCVADEWHSAAVCQDGECVINTIDCNAPDTGCANGYCEPGAGCQVHFFATGTTCGGDECDGTKWQFKDSCNGSGFCVDGGSIDCETVNSECVIGHCTETGCVAETALSCTNGPSSACVGSIWHDTDYCSGGVAGVCIDAGSQDCDAYDTPCRDWSCDEGCKFENAPASTQCQPPKCINDCSEKAPVTCNGAGSCSGGGGWSSCGGDHCVDGACTSACTSNSDCCDTAGDDRTCVVGQCADKAACGATSDASDPSDCKPGLTSVNCDTLSCAAGTSGWSCFKQFNADVSCGCEAPGADDVCTSYKSCWHC